MTEKAKHVLDSIWATRITKGVAVVALLLSVWLSWQLKQQSDCQFAFNEASNASTRVRSEAAAGDRAAMDKLFERWAADPGQSVAAIRDYVAARKAADATRTANPIPPPPSETCGS